jgi:hypothetical protein
MLSERKIQLEKELQVGLLREEAIGGRQLFTAQPDTRRMRSAVNGFRDGLAACAP